MPTTVTTHQLLMECVEQWREIVLVNMGKLKMVVLTNHVLTGVCVSVCDNGFWSDTVVLCFGPNYPCVLYNFARHHRRERERERERESQTWRISFP